MRTRILLPLVVILVAILACAIPGRGGGTVQGVVYADLNGDGFLDENEQDVRLEGVTVTLTECGATRTQLTDADGKFRFTNLPTGTCRVSVSKSGWKYAGSYPALGAYPIPVASGPTSPTAFSIYMAPAASAIPTTTVLSPTDSPPPTATLLGPAMVTPTSNDVNCRFGPGTNYAVVGTLRTGENVPILGTVSGRGWWQIENPRQPRTFCWVAALATTATGDLAAVREIPAPSGLVTEASIRVVGGPTVHGFCGGPNPVEFEASITTNGPANVTYRLEIYNVDGSLRNVTEDAVLTFSTFDTKVFDPGGAYKTDCGSFYVKLIITAPNAKTAQYNWSVVYP